MEDTAATIHALEERLLSYGVRHSRDDLDLLLADDFVEFGASGRTFDKRAIVAALAEEQTELRRVLDDFRLRLLAPNVALATYVLVGTDATSARRHSLRSSVWVQRDQGWQMVFHQGTLEP
jgi:hypothetical protein